MVVFGGAAEGGQVVADEEARAAGEEDPALQVAQNLLAAAGDLQLLIRQEEAEDGDDLERFQRFERLDLAMQRRALDRR